MKKFSLILSLCMALVLMLGTAAAYAFDDLPDGKDKDKVRSLQERGIISGYGSSFKGGNKLSNAEGVHLIVKAFDLNIDNIRFFKEPKASDSFDRVPDDAWYAGDFIISAYTGLNLPRTIDPEADMTREAFAHYLLAGLLHTGNYPFTKMLVHVADESDVNPDYRGDLQLLLNAKIVQLGEDGKFKPTKPITRLDAAVMAYEALEFKNAHQPDQEDPAVNDEVSLSVEKVNADVNKITLSWGEKPNGGYGISIAGIEFKDNGTAEIHYKLHTPEKGKMYAQVITTPKAVTYVSSAYKAVPVLEH